MVEASELHDFAVRVTQESLEFFRNKVPSKGKPKPGEWTVYAAILLQTNDGALAVFSAGTGSKCLGECELSEAGDLVNDAHAEAVARRSLVRGLMCEMSEGGGRCVERAGRKWRLREGVKLHLFVTHPPCGDATISFRGEDCAQEPDRKRSRRDQVRTGAKCVDGQEGDALGAGGRDYHTALGALRRKPGRGFPTRSLSCSDKIIKWSVVGVQGSMLSALIDQPVFLHSITICSSLVCHDSVKRALVTRACSLDCSVPELHVLPKDLFEFSQSVNASASPCSVACVNSGVEGFKFEVCVDGRKQGCIKKHFGSKRARLSICRKELAEKFCTLLPDKSLVNCGEQGEIRYRDLKRLSENRGSRKAAFKVAFPLWTSRHEEKLDAFLVHQHHPVRLVVLFRSVSEESPEEKCPYASALNRLEGKLEVRTIPTLEFAFRLEVLSEPLKRPWDFSGLILTSPRAVWALREAADVGLDLEDWKHKPVFSVGGTTAESCGKLLNVSALGSDSGNGEQLAGFIERHKELIEDKERPLMFPTSNLVNNDSKIVLGLGASGLTVEQVVCYETLPHSNLATSMKELGSLVASAKLPPVFVFFSPSCFRACLAYLRGDKRFIGVQLGSLGPSTSAAITDKGLDLALECDQPNPRALAEAVKRYAI